MTQPDLDKPYRPNGNNMVTLREYLDERFRASDRLLEMRFTELEKRIAGTTADSEKAINAALAGQEKAVAAALNANDRALTKAEDASEKRFASVNEFRATLSDQARDLMPRSEAMAIIQGLTKEVQEIRNSVTKEESRSGGIASGGNALFMMVIGFAAIGGLILDIVLRVSGK